MIGLGCAHPNAACGWSVRAQAAKKARHETRESRQSMRYVNIRRDRYRTRYSSSAPAVLLAGVLCGTLGCVAGAAEQSEPPLDLTVADDVSAAPLVASLKLRSGQVIDFYDYGSSALVVESGAAYMTPALPNTKESIPGDQIVNLWTLLAPETPVPAALADLQRRLASLPSYSEAAPAMPSLDTGGAKSSISGSAVPNAPVGCNNGCCDFNWLSTLTECQGHYFYSWFLYNYGWSFANSSNDALYQGLVCSAVGTSIFTVSVGGSGGTWSVPQATYRWFHWTAGSTRQSMTSSVNSSSAQHLHTYCGGVN